MIATEAARLLDVSKAKMARLLGSGETLYTSDPRNERAKLVKWSGIDVWLAMAPHPRVPRQHKTPTPTNQEAEQSS